MREIIKSIKFGIFSNEMVHKLSVAKITIPDTYDEEGFPIDGGLLDQRLGVIDPSLRCKTCGARMRACPGHFGHIDLARPVIHPGFAKVIYLLLQATCPKCHKLLLNKEEIQQLKEVIEAEVEEVEEETGKKKKLSKSLINKLKQVKKCPYCGEVHPLIKFEKPTFFYRVEKKEDGKLENIRMKVPEIEEWLRGISDEDCKLLGLDPEVARPEYMILHSLLVPPVNIRPSITLETGERSEDDLTHKLVDIMRINQRLEQNINAGAPQLIIDDLWELLQYHITTYFDNETSGLPPARHRSGRPLKTLAQRLKGKEGRFRYNLSGKRVNFSARSVISVDPWISINEVGVPKEIAMELTYPVKVNSQNIDYCKELIEREEYPRALYVISPDGTKRKITEKNKEEIKNEINVGYVVERQIKDGDIVLFNRQPSLHRISMMAHYVRILPGKTFRINIAATEPYNADFDGDEMNLHVPQSEDAIAEAKYLMDTKFQLFSPRHGEIIIGPIEDTCTGIYILTQDSSYFSKEEACDILAQAGKEIERKEKRYSGKEIFSNILPKISLEIKTKKGKVVIENGKLKEGVVDKDVLRKIIGAIALQVGFEEAREFIDNITRVGNFVISRYGLTVSLEEYTLPKEAMEKINERREKGKERVNELIKEYKEERLVPLPGRTSKESLEAYIVKELGEVRDGCEEIIKKYIDEKNPALLMTQSGARGKMLNFIQISAMLGQQAVRGQRINRGYRARVLPHLKKNDLSAEARGFIGGNFRFGLNPIEFFFHSVGGRESIVQKGLGPAKSGYMQRRLIHALQDLYVDEDLSVKDSKNDIVQFVYGGDALHPMFSHFEEYNIKKREEFLVEPGEAVGIVAAQSLGEPATQMTLRLFHFAGVAEQVPTGLPRVIEIIDAKSVPSIPMMDIYIDKKFKNNLEKVKQIASKIEEVKISEVAKVEEDFDDMSITITFSKNKLKSKGVKISEAIEKIKSEKIGRMNIKGNRVKIKIKTNSYAKLRRSAVRIKELIVKGIKGIERAIVLQEGEEYFIRASGSNLREVMKVEGVDKSKIFTTHIHEIAEVLGIEAARNAIVRELYSILKSNKLNVDIRHIMLLADTMTREGVIKPIGRQGLVAEKPSVLARAAFEETVKHLMNAAATGEVDRLTGVTENIIIGQEVPVGTGMVKLILPKEKIEKIK
ncbi:MAG: DNA-directed RNA polymerase subunit A' [Candidatus Micrarchaeales archaeon]